MNTTAAPSTESNGPTDTATLVTQIYRSNWVDFYQWKQDDSTKSLASLLVSSPEFEEDPSDFSDDDDTEIPTSSLTDSHSLIRITEYPSSHTITLTPTTTTPQNTLSPNPNYTSTTPLRRSILIGDDPNPMPFLPFSDDPTFKHESYTNDHYDSVAWQDKTSSKSSDGFSTFDPDVEVICVQSVKDLLSEKYKLDLNQILNTRIIPTNIIQNIQLYIGARRRDYPLWPSSSPLHSTNVPYSPPYNNTLSPTQVLADFVQYFCISDCLHGYCDTHSSERRPLPPSIPPTLSNENLYNSVNEPCGRYCFVLGRHTWTLSYWSPEDLDILHTTLAHSPDTLPCDLSIIIRKPCNEVATKRQQWLSTQPPLGPSKSLSRKNTGLNKLEYADFDLDTFIPNYPCTHSGPCTSSNSCPCALNNAHCTGSCLCSLPSAHSHSHSHSHSNQSRDKDTCIRRWRGCRCTRSKLAKNGNDESQDYINNLVNKTCGTDRCPCFRARRECDPVFCVKCESRDSSTDVCKNSGIQHMRHKRGIVHRSKWGLGYYIAEPAREGDLITEYVGDLVYDLTVRSRDVVAAHTNRQYMFKLNSLLTVDGTTTGNESRYINHASGEKANVQAHVRLVNSEHRIGIYASKDINPGTELLLDYGGEFFHHTQPSSSSRKQAPKLKTTSSSQSLPLPHQSQRQIPDDTSTPSFHPISDSPLVLSASFFAQPTSAGPPLQPQPEHTRAQSPTPLPRGIKSSTTTRPAGLLKSIPATSASQKTQSSRPVRRTRRINLADLHLQEDTVPAGEDSEYRAQSAESGSDSHSD